LDPNKEILVRYIAVNELKSPRKLRERLGLEKELLLTNNGKPMALMLDLGDDDPESVAAAVREVRSRLALTRIREAADRSGAARMSGPDIDSVITATRRARRKAS